MYSCDDVLPGEAQEEFDQEKSELIAALNPADAVQERLAERAAKLAWKIKRGERAEEASAAKAIHGIVEGVAEREAREVARLAPLVESDREAVRELRTFPGGIDYLLGEWAILQARLVRGKNLLATQRQRCFALLAAAPVRRAPQ